MTVIGDGGKAIEQSTFVRRDADDYDETGGRVDWIRATFAVWKRPQAAHRASVRAISATMSIRSSGSVSNLTRSW